MLMFGARALLALAAPLLLTGCLLTPGKFASTLRINADRSFDFAYKGEVIAMDPGKDLKQGMTEGTDEDGADGDGEQGAAVETPIAWAADHAKNVDKQPAAPAESEDDERKYRAMAEALSREQGYRSVEYVGQGKFLIDYAISGRLDRSFVYPYNIDAEIIFPFIAIEVRNNNTVRVKAPAFGKESSDDAVPGRSEAASQLDGSFTLDTDAEIVSQNNEDGATQNGARRVIRWKATPLSKSAPMAVLRFR